MRTVPRVGAALIIWIAVATSTPSIPAEPQVVVQTLEDIYGDSGDTFQAAIGIRNEEKDAPSEPDPQVGFGLSVDDVVLMWREFELVQDVTDCATAGACAVLDFPSALSFDGRTVLPIVALEKTPVAVNDCDLDGTPDGGPTATNDCDDDGRADLPVLVVSSSGDVEILYLNQTDNLFEFRGELAVSTLTNVPGILWIQPSPAGAAEVRAIYLDNDDGNGRPCQNSANPNELGRVEATTTILLTTGPIALGGASVLLTDNGDNDGFADTDETVNMRIRVTNNGPVPIRNLSGRLETDDPSVECVLQSVAPIASQVDPGEQVLSEGVFVFKIGDVDRTTMGLDDLDELTATFDLILTSDEFDVAAAPLSVVLDLDLDVVVPDPPPTVTPFFEGFEVPVGLGQFSEQNLDAGRSSAAASNGYRCQYHDPDWIGSNSYGVITNCFLGGTPAQASAFHWQVHQPEAIDGGRAYSGSRSLYMGIFGRAADEHTTPLANLEAVRTFQPINLNFSGPSPELRFKHQISLMNFRSVSPLGFSRTADRAVVQLQLADTVGNPVGEWIKLKPYYNVYDAAAIDNFFQCTFDPVDDGNTEDDFFETLAENPRRRLGPSSTCYSGGFADSTVFARLGETFSAFNANALGRASQGPGLKGSLGLGTWIESRFSLERFRGRRVRLRFLTTSLKVGAQPNWESASTFNPTPRDDGWWIDDVEIANALSAPVMIRNDDKDNGGLPACATTCSVVSASMTIDPPVLPAPGQVAVLSAAASVADRCVNGALQFRFWIDADGNAQGGDARDRLLRGWTDNPTIVQAPSSTTDYVVEVRCSSLPSCDDSLALRYVVVCPASGNLGFPSVTALDAGTLAWNRSLTHDFARGLLSTLSSYDLLDSGQNVGPSSTFDVSADVVVAGAGRWYLFRENGELDPGTGLCNDPGVSWGSSERDGSLP